jgi:hypothetical protein
MKNHTLNAIVKQTQAMNASSYSIGLYNYTDSNMINRHNQSVNNILESINWLKYKNLNNYNIFIKPSVEINRAIILLDDVDENIISQLKGRGLFPSCIIETSPNNFQAWLSFGDEPMIYEYRKFITGIIVREFGCDKGCSDANHYGRLAGFTNRKEKYKINNLYPYVLCREATGQHIANYQKIRDWIAKKYIGNEDSKYDLFNKINDNIIQVNVFKKYYKQWERLTIFKNRTLDISRGEFAVVCRMIKEGFTRNDIFNDFKLHGYNLEARKNKYVDYYINRTIDAALKHCLNGLQ